MNKEPIKAIAEIICHEMGIAQNRVFLFNDLRELPKDDGLFVVLDEKPFKPHGASLTYKEINNVYTEVQTLNIKQIITISLISKNNEARLRQYEAQMAMNSTYAQQCQETYGFHVSTTSTVQNRSFVEATARLARFDTEVVVTTAIEKTQEVEYYSAKEYSSVFES